MHHPTALIRPRSARSAVGLFLAALVAVPVLSAAGAAPAAAKFKFKKLEISHNTRGRPILVVRRTDGRWVVKNGDKLFLDLDVHVKSGVAHRIWQVWFRFGGTSHTLYKGKKGSNIKINGVRGAFAGSELGYLRAFGANFCKTAGAGLHPRNFAVEIAIVDSGGQAIWKRKDISGYVRCVG